MSEFLDDLARSLAVTMPRRRALRVLGGALAAVAVPSLRARPAFAAGSSETSARAVTCGSPCKQPVPVVCNCPSPVNPSLCFHTCGVPGCKCCCYPVNGKNTGANCCPPGYRCGRPGEASCMCEDPCGSSNNCCGPNQECLRGSGLVRCIDKCKLDETRCGSELCCKRNEECTRARIGNALVSRCVPRCPEGQARCGEDHCCPRGQKCIDPDRHLCDVCDKTQIKCGRKCCDRRGTCCDAKKGLCCKPNEKCGSWPPDKHICCRYHSCQSRPGANPNCCQSASEVCLGEHTGGGPITSSSPKICCPPDRQTRNSAGGAPIGCCPPGTIAAPNGSFVLGGDTTGFCCPQGSICGSGESATCCPTGQSCCPGARCHDLLHDPQNCGSCGHVCALGAICRDGQCAVP